VEESFYGIKTHYDQLEDLSDEKATADEKVWERQLARRARCAEGAGRSLDQVETG
jgi:hypothetical protein